MTLNEYQTAALKTAVYPDTQNIIYPCLGLAGEAGEVADKVKKVLRDKNSMFSNETKQELAKELGDVLWYVAVLANDLGFDLNAIASINVRKLASRQQRNMLQGSGDNR